MAAPLMHRRRQVVKGLGIALGAIPLRGFSLEGRAAAHFTHGVASGDPLADRVILWSRAVPGDGAAASLDARWEVASDVGFRRIVASGTTATDAGRDFTLKVDATGLAPSQTYFYRFTVAGVTSPVGRTRTLPIEEAERFTMAVCSCSNYPQGYFHAYREIAKARLDVVLHLGDYIYEYPAGTYANPIATQQLGREVAPLHEILALEDYRTRYGLYRSDPDLQAAHAAHPWICVWDDHELANDTWRGGAENHNPGEGDFGARIAAARKAYHEWMPIRTAAQADQGPIYRSFKVGRLADLIMLDTRLQGRDQQLSYTNDLPKAESPVAFRAQQLEAPERTLLGLEQEAWLGNQLAASKARGATWQVLGQQVLMGKVNIPNIPDAALAGVTLPDYVKRRLEAMRPLAALGMPLNLDAWDGYPAARERAQQLLLQEAVSPLVLAGDTHNAWAFNLATQAGAAVGVEIGTPGVSSPGMETYLPMPPAQLAAALRAASPEIVDLDTSRRGWSEVTLTPSAMLARWHFVSSVLTPTYQVSSSDVLRSAAGARRFA